MTQPRIVNVPGMDRVPRTMSTILIVDDEPNIVELVSLYLQRDGFKVETASTGIEALRKQESHIPDMVILDLMLPDIEGEELCRIIRERSDAPIIMLTAKSGEEDRIQGLGIGADDYVVKPFSPRELVARVKAQLRRTRKIARKVLSFNRGTLTLDTENYEVSKRGVPAILTSTEFRILMALAEKPGRVFTRLQLINMVQGYDFEGYDRTIDAHIKNLRQKIEDNPKDSQFIRTVYGVGYKFSGVLDED
ncbi:MAG TPA: response regulator transcription factor [Thermodesulfovibrionales bacterium]|nr:response regulator transcription factor [Thermodesulfovibrionales bacterium]